jgi:hypothetical protein
MFLLIIGNGNSAAREARGYFPQIHPIEKGRRMTRYFAFAAGLLIATTAHAMKGDEFARLMDSYQKVQGAKSPSRDDELGGAAFIAYIRGVEDSMNGVRFCITAGASSGQQVAFIVKYVKGHPEELHNGATTLIVQALQPAYPCQQ